MLAWWRHKQFWETSVGKQRATGSITLNIVQHLFYGDKEGARCCHKGVIPNMGSPTSWSKWSPAYYVGPVNFPLHLYCQDSGNAEVKLRHTLGTLESLQDLASEAVGLCTTLDRKVLHGSLKNAEFVCWFAWGCGPLTVVVGPYSLMCAFSPIQKQAFFFFLIYLFFLSFSWKIYVYLKGLRRLTLLAQICLAFMLTQSTTYKRGWPQ